MNKATPKSIVRTALLLLTLLGVMQTAASAEGSDSRQNNENANARHNRIVGVWDIQVTVLNCSNGAPLASFRGLHKYELGGTAQVIPATNPAALSPHVGMWNHVRKNYYQLAFKMFRFDAAGNNIGWVVVRNDVAITEDGTGYAGSGRAETFDSNGNLVGASCPTFTGTRFE